MLLKRYQERAEMNEADQLAMNLINLTDYVLRLKCLIFKMEFDNRDGTFEVFILFTKIYLVELKPAFESLTRASNQARKAKKFSKIVEFITEELKKSMDKVNYFVPYSLSFSSNRIISQI